MLTNEKSLLPYNPSLAGHQTFAFRIGWLKKGIDAIQNVDAGGGGIFSRDDSLVTLGVGKNMVQSIRHWLLVSGMADEVIKQGTRWLQPSLLGKALFGSLDNAGWDPFLEDDASLWLLHWHLAGPGSSAFSWVWTFNVFREYEFSRESLTDSVMSGTIQLPKQPSRETVGRDIDCLVHTYVQAEGKAGIDTELNCPLQQLRLIEASHRRYYRFRLGPKPSLPGHIFVYAMIKYWLWKQPESLTMTTWDIAYGEGSPGTIFKLDEDSVLTYLDEIGTITSSDFCFEDTAQARQVVRKPVPIPNLVDYLQDYYGQQHF